MCLINLAIKKKLINDLKTGNISNTLTLRPTSIKHRKDLAKTMVYKNSHMQKIERSFDVKKSSGLELRGQGGRQEMRHAGKD